MKINRNPMKKIIIASFVLFLGILGAKAQNSDFNLQIETTSPSGISNNDGNISITVEGNSPTYTYILYDKVPWSGGIELQKAENLKTSQHTFTNLKAGDYLVCVSDANNFLRCEKVSVGNQ